MLNVVNKVCEKFDVFKFHRSTKQQTLITIGTFADYGMWYKKSFDSAELFIAYRRHGKICWAKCSHFQPHWIFCGNTFTLPWLKVLIIWHS